MVDKAKPVFFCLMRGLRGGYMPDDVTHEGVRTFDAFVESLKQEVDFQEMAWNVDEQTPEQISALLQQAWHHAQRGSLELCVAVGARWNEENDTEELNEAYGLTVSQSCARDLLEYRRNIANS
jgi:hypothetical protein